MAWFLRATIFLFWIAARMTPIRTAATRTCCDAMRFARQATSKRRVRFRMTSLVPLVLSRPRPRGFSKKRNRSCHKIASSLRYGIHLLPQRSVSSIVTSVSKAEDHFQSCRVPKKARKGTVGTAVWHKTTAPGVLPLLVTLALLISSPAIAGDSFPISVPQECTALAVREGVGTVINNRYEAAKAKAKLFRLSSRDPEVVQCRQAVKRMQDAARGHALRDRTSSPVAGQAKPDVH